jgi:hypothetical protein
VEVSVLRGWDPKVPVGPEPTLSRMNFSSSIPDMFSVQFQGGGIALSSSTVFLLSGYFLFLDVVLALSCHAVVKKKRGGYTGT